jgi:hypothetical protein
MATPSPARLAARKKIARAIRLTWSSLESHLDYSHRAKKKGVKACKHCGDADFDTDCVKEYAETIKILADLM